MFEIPYHFIPIILGGMGFIQAVTTTLIAAFVSRENKKRDKQASLGAEATRLSMRMMSAVISLASASAYAQKEGRTNGKTDAALRETAEAQRDYFDFVNGVASKKIAAS